MRAAALAFVPLLVSGLAGCTGDGVHGDSCEVFDSCPKELVCVLDPCGAYTFAGSEPFIAASPTDPDHAVVVAHFYQPGTNFWHPWLRVAVTTDGGRNWTHRPLPGAIAFGASQTNSYNFAADPMVAFRGETVVVAGLAGRGTSYSCVAPAGDPVACQSTFDPVDAGVGVLLNALDLVVWMSNDGGKTFSDPVVVAQADGAFLFRNGIPQTPGPLGDRNLGPANDKEFLLVEPASGRIHLLWSTIEDTGAFLHASFSDDGINWSTVRPLGPGYGIWAASANGTLVATYRDPASEELLVVTSESNGESWSTGLAFAMMPGYDTAPVSCWGKPPRCTFAYPTEDRSAINVQTGLEGVPAPALLGDSPRRLAALALDGQGSGVLTSYMSDNGTQAQHTWGVAVVGGQVVGSPVRLSHATADASTIFDYMGAAAGPAGSYWAAWIETGDTYGIFVAPLRAQAVASPPVSPSA